MQRYTCYLAVALACGLCGAAPAAISVVTTTTDLTDLASQLGGDKVEVTGVCKSGEDPHFTRPTPSVQRKLSNARLFLQIGLDLEPWAPKLLEGARNPNLVHSVVSKGVKVLELRSGVNPGQGDVHAAGNPHFMHDPANARIVVSNILGALIAVDGGNAEYYRGKAKSYLATLASKSDAWTETAKAFAGKKVVAYHDSWVYFAKRYKLDVIGYVEPRPGIPPKPKDVAALVEKMKAEGVKIIITQSFYPRANVDSIAAQTGAKVVVLSGYPDGAGSTYLSMMTHNVSTLAKAAG